MTTDRARKILPNHATALIALIEAYVGQAWIEDLDLSTLRSETVEHVGDRGDQRINDLVWSVRTKGRGQVQLYFMFEFQSSRDPEMPVRMLSYTALFLQRWIRPHPGRSGNLPRVIGIVPSSGAVPWEGPRNIKELFGAVPEALAAFQPSMEFLAIEERLDPGLPAAERNLMQAVFRVERSRTKEEAVAALAHLRDCVDGETEPGLDRFLSEWLEEDCLPTAVERFKPLGSRR